MYIPLKSVFNCHPFFSPLLSSHHTKSSSLLLSIRLQTPFTHSASSRKQIGLTITGEANGDRFGYSVSLSDDAKTLAVGAPFANGEDGDDVGHVRVYRTDDSESGWTKIVEDIDGEAADDNSGWSVSLSGDGKSVAIGSDGNDDNGAFSGHVRVFVAE